jgi:hypothetical protein
MNCTTVRVGPMAQKLTTAFGITVVLEAADIPKEVIARKSSQGRPQARRE